jgi:hypothetical protein
MVERLIDHCYWLCPDCASTYTVTLEEAKPIIRHLALHLRKAAPTPKRAKHDSVMVVTDAPKNSF